MAKWHFIPLAGMKAKLLNLVYCDDVVDAIVLAAEQHSSISRVYFIGSENAYLDHQIIDAISETTAKTTVKMRFPLFLLYPIALFSELYGRIASVPVYLNREKIKELHAAEWNCSIDRARRDFGYIPRWSLSEGIRTTFQWYTTHGLL